MKANILMAVAVTAELTGAELSEAALRVMASDLDAYPELDVLRALDRCRRELKGRLTLAAVLERLEEADGRPGADEAWAIAISAQDECETVVWTDEISQAFAVARPILEARDKVGARMAFRDAYERITRESRAERAPVRWSVSLGNDPERRASALSAAVALRRIEAGAAQHLLPGVGEDSGVVAALLSNDTKPLLDAPMSSEERARCLRGIAAVSAHLDALREQEEARRLECEHAAERFTQARMRRVEAEKQRLLQYADERGIDIEGRA